MSAQAPALDRLLLLAMDSAAWLGHDYIGTEHLALALLRELDGGARRVLESANVPQDFAARIAAVFGQELPPEPPADPDSVAERAIRHFGAEVVGSEPAFPPYTPRALKILDLAHLEAQRDGAAAVVSEHVLLGLVKEGQGIAARVLQEMGVSSAVLRLHARNQLSWNPLLDLLREAEERDEQG